MAVNWRRRLVLLRVYIFRVGRHIQFSNFVRYQIGFRSYNQEQYICRMLLPMIFDLPLTSKTASSFSILFDFDFSLFLVYIDATFSFKSISSYPSFACFGRYKKRKISLLFTYSIFLIKPS